MNEDQLNIPQEIQKSDLYSEDLAPIPMSDRTWSTWSLTAIWIGMAVCIPTYLLASYMIKAGLGWLEALIIIGLANILITIPMVLNGHAGVKYGIPFPVLGRSSFGTKGIHLASILRALVACGWFGIQTWIGGLAFYAIFNVLTGAEPSIGLSFGKFVAFGLFWLLNMFFIWKGTESIKWLEEYSAPILILIGILLIGWGAKQGGGFSNVLQQSEQLARPMAQLNIENNATSLTLTPITYNSNNTSKANEYQLFVLQGEKEKPTGWKRFEYNETVNTSAYIFPEQIAVNNTKFFIQYRNTGNEVESSKISIPVVNKDKPPAQSKSKIWTYITWLSIMMGFWATMSLSIADITRYAKSQRAQVRGQFLGLPATMMLFSFVGIFVTCAAIINFKDILVSNDAPWDPVSLLAKFKNPIVVVISQIFMIIATLSTNIAANVIAPSNAFSNLIPKKIDFKTGGLITGVIGILTCPWWLMDDISSALIYVSGLLGPVLGILLADYFFIRKKKLQLVALYQAEGEYAYGKSGINSNAMVAFFVGVVAALIWLLVPSLTHLSALSWFSGFFVSMILYVLLMRSNVKFVFE